MQAKGLLTLSGLTLVAVAAAAVMWQRNETSGAQEKGIVFPELLDHVNDVAQLRIQGPESSVTLERGDDGWGLVERGGYP
ncbi:MAG TPA: hypothetical protein ENJ09_13295, partial [Planctomycetes bacterium]|nr:hypothetical protein [Planctomycetota bacterium]